MILEDFSNMDDSRHTGLDYTRQDLSDESELTSFLEDLLEIIRADRSGDVASYIPQVSLRASPSSSASRVIRLVTSFRRTAGQGQP